MKVVKSQTTQAYIDACVAQVEIIYSDTKRLFAETGERMTRKALIEALAEGAMERVAWYPKGGRYATIAKKVERMIAAQYFGGAK